MTEAVHTPVTGSNVPMLNPNKGESGGETAVIVAVTVPAAGGTHFDRTAFKVARIYATLAPDRRTANFKFAPDEQALKCTVAPDAFMPIQNAWGRQGWTTAMLSKLKAA